MESGVGAEVVREDDEALEELGIAVAVASKLSRRVEILVCESLPPDVALSELKRSCRFSMLAEGIIGSGEWSSRISSSWVAPKFLALRPYCLGWTVIPAAAPLVERMRMAQSKA